MASTSSDNVQASTSTQSNPPDDLEPGACPESILNPTDSFEEFASEMSSSLQERNTSLAANNSTISEIQSEIGDSKANSEIKATKSTDDLQGKNVCIVCFLNPFRIVSNIYKINYQVICIKYHIKRQ